MKLEPRVHVQSDRMPDIDRGEKRERLDEQDQRRRESAHERQPVGRSNRQINQRHRPGEEDKNFEEVRDRATPQSMAANGQERALENEPQDYCEKIKSARPENAVAQRRHGMRDRNQETDRRSNDELSIHRPEL